MILPAEDDRCLLRPEVDPVDRVRRLVEDERDALRAEDHRPDIERGLGGRCRKDRRGGDGYDVEQPVEAGARLLTERVERRRRDRPLGRVDGLPRLRQQGECFRRVSVDEIHAGREDLVEAVVDRLEGSLRRSHGAERLRPGTAASERPERAPEADHHHDEREDGDGRPALRLPLRGGRRHPAIRGPAVGQQVLPAVDEPREHAAGRVPRAAGRGLNGRDTACDIVGQGDRGPVGCAGQGLGRADRDQRPRSMGRGDLGGLEGDHRVAAVAVGGEEAVVEVLHRRLRMERDHRVLELIRTEPAHHVRRDQDERVADRDLAAPDVGLQIAGRQAPLAVRVGQGREAGLADEVRLRRPDRGHVQLVGPDDGDPDPDRPVLRRPVQPEPFPLVVEPLVRRRDRLLDADPDPGRLVVVILAPDRLGGELGRLLGPGGRDRRGDDQVQVALRARDCADRRLDHHDRVGRIRRAVRLGDDAELHLQTDGQVRVSRGCGRRMDEGRRGTPRRGPVSFGTRAPRLAGRSGQYTRQVSSARPGSRSAPVRW